jgi:hypothetical protein
MTRFLLLSSLALAADPIDGRWRSEVTVSSGESRPFFLELKAAGTKLTGTFIDIFGVGTPIREGVWQDSKFSFEFDWQGDRPGVCKVTGELAGNEIRYEQKTSRWSRKVVGRLEAKR